MLYITFALVLSQTASGVTNWGQFGLAGLVIMALFALVSLFVKWSLDYINSRAVEHTLERIEWDKKFNEQRAVEATMHREERREWKLSSDKVVGELTRVVEELNKRWM